MKEFLLKVVSAVWRRGSKTYNAEQPNKQLLTVFFSSVTITDQILDIDCCKDKSGSYLYLR